MRVLLLGAETAIGAQLAGALEQDATVVAPPPAGLAAPWLGAAGDEAGAIDTLVDVTPPDAAATAALLAAAAATPVRKLVVASSAHVYGCGPDDPAFFTEQTHRNPPRSAFERAAVAREDAIAAFAAAHPRTATTTLRFADRADSPLLRLPFVPGILGFDPRVQFIHDDDVVAALRHAVVTDAPGVHNVAPDGVLALSEVAGLLGKPFLPLLPPYATGPALTLARVAGIRIAPELRRLLRYGRGLDNRSFKQTGFRFRLTTRETLQARTRPHYPSET